MIVGRARPVIRQQVLYGPRLEIAIHQRVVLAQCGIHARAERTLEPLVYHVHCESALLPTNDLGGQKVETHLAVCVLTRPPADLQRGIEPRGVLHYCPVEIGHPNLQPVRHRHLVAIHEEFVRQRRLQLEPLKSRQLVATGRSVLQFCPAVEDRVARTGFQHTVPEQSVDHVRWLNRKDTLVSSQAVRHVERIDASLQRLVSGQAWQHRPDKSAQGARHASP